jgi:organic hydroperoxide reductase OsmC/OhrA
VPEPRAKRFDYGISLDRHGRAEAKGASLAMPQDWAPEHLVLAGLAHCSLKSLRFHARRAGIEVEAEATANGVVTKRDGDGRYAFVEIECRIEASLDPKPVQDDVDALLGKAERDCFVGASLQPPPRYVWSVA